MGSWVAVGSSRVAGCGVVDERGWASGTEYQRRAKGDRARREGRN